MMPYYAYVLRLWPETQDDSTVWRFALLEPHTGQRLGFETPDALINHLINKTQEGASVDPPMSGTPSDSATN
jgi:hypothetical protein